MTENKKVKKKKPLLFRAIKKTIAFFHGKKQFLGTENIPNEPCILVGNHSQMHGPILGEGYFSDDTILWCVGDMLDKKKCSKYAYEDFWSRKPKATRWIYKLIAPIVAHLIRYMLNNARCIPVYRDMRALTTYKLSVQHLTEGKNIIIFPEERVNYNEIVNRFQERFIELARVYYKRTGKELSFVPMYYAVKLQKVVFGKPIKFDKNKTVDEQMSLISTYLMDEITALAKSLPPHKVVPYENLSQRKYNMSK